MWPFKQKKSGRLDLEKSSRMAREMIGYKARNLDEEARWEIFSGFVRDCQNSKSPNYPMTEVGMLASKVRAYTNATGEHINGIALDTKVVLYMDYYGCMNPLLCKCEPHLENVYPETYNESLN